MKQFTSFLNVLRNLLYATLRESLHLAHLYTHVLIHEVCGVYFYCSQSCLSNGFWHPRTPVLAIKMPTTIPDSLVDPRFRVGGDSSPGGRGAPSAKACFLAHKWSAYLIGQPIETLRLGKPRIKTTRLLQLLRRPGTGHGKIQNLERRFAWNVCPALQPEETTNFWKPYDIAQIHSSKGQHKERCMSLPGGPGNRRRN